jgi:hypothetical protein
MAKETVLISVAAERFIEREQKGSAFDPQAAALMAFNESFPNIKIV